MKDTVRAIGVDPGSVSFDLCGLEGDKLFLDESIPAAEIEADPRTLVDALESAGPVDMILGPSGYGLPWVKAQELTAQQINLLQLSQSRDHGRVTILGGMREMFRLLQETDLPIYFAPAVIHLATVPAHRKANRIDMGTADKLCAVALGIYDQSRHLNIAYEKTSFIYVELGGAFTAVIAVDKGQVVDGLGGTSGPLGYLALGAMDGELAYFLGSFPKEVLSSGGAAYIARQPELPPKKLLNRSRSDPRCRLAWEAFMEGVIKSVAAEMSIIDGPREILISGRLCRLPEIRKKVAAKLSCFAPVRRVKSFAQIAKEAAVGAALIAEGLAGGMHKNLIDVMGLGEVSGSALDHLYIAGAESLRRSY